MQFIFFVPPNEELEGTLHPQKFGCTPKNEYKRVHVPSDEKTCGHTAMHVPVHNPDEINEIFDSISYDKICTLNPCQKSSHPIHVPVHNPDEINEIFDYLL